MAPASPRPTAKLLESLEEYARRVAASESGMNFERALDSGQSESGGRRPDADGG